MVELLLVPHLICSMLRRNCFCLFKEVTNLVENDFEKHPSLESIRQAYQGLQFRFNEIGIGEVENELKKI